MCETYGLCGSDSIDKGIYRNLSIVYGTTGDLGNCT